MPSRAQREKKDTERRNIRIQRIEFELIHGDALKAQDGGCYVGLNDRKQKGGSMKIDDLTIGEAKELAGMFQKCGATKEDAHWTIGDTWFIRTVTYHLVGKLKAVTAQELVLEGGTVMWIADDGRFTDAISKGIFNETEIYGDQDVIVGRGSIVDATRLKVNIKVVQK